MDWPTQGDGQHWVSAGENLTTSGHLQLAFPGVSHTKGAWTELSAATPFAATELLVLLSMSPIGADGVGLLDVGVGALGAEQVLVENLALDTRVTSSMDFLYRLPLAIPAGTRLTVRQQSDGIAIGVMAWLGAGSLAAAAPLGAVEAWGAIPATSRGTVIDPGTAAHTKGAWTELIAASARPARAIIATICGLKNTSRSTCSWLLDVGVGALGAEQVVLPNLSFRSFTTTDEIGPTPWGPLPLAIPAGSRVSARAQCSITTATPRLFGLVVYGIG